VRPAGSLTGRVGDLAFGLTKPVLPLRESSIVAGFLEVLAAGVGTGTVVAAGAVVFFAKSLRLTLEIFLAGASVGGFKMSFVGLFEVLGGSGDLGVLTASGDLGALLAVFAVDTGAGLAFTGTSAFVVAGTASGLGAGAVTTALAKLSPIPLDTTLLGARVAARSTGSPGCSFVFVSSSSVTLSGLALGMMSGVLGAAGLRGGILSSGKDGFWGDSGRDRGVAARVDTGLDVIFLRAAAVSMNGSDVGSERGCGVVVPVSLLGVRLGFAIESVLIPRVRPNLPSFSTATNWVRILERGRGESDGGGVPGKPFGDLPLDKSSGLVSPRCSNMAARPLTPGISRAGARSARGHWSLSSAFGRLDRAESEGRGEIPCGAGTGREKGAVARGSHEQDATSPDRSTAWVVPRSGSQDLQAAVWIQQRQVAKEQLRSASGCRARGRRWCRVKQEVKGRVLEWQEEEQEQAQQQGRDSKCERDQ